MLVDQGLSANKLLMTGCGGGGIDVVTYKGYIADCQLFGYKIGRKMRLCIHLPVISLVVTEDFLN